MIVHNFNATVREVELIIPGDIELDIYMSVFNVIKKYDMGDSEREEFMNSMRIVMGRHSRAFSMVYSVK